MTNLTPERLAQIEAHPTFADIKPLIAEVKRLQEEAMLVTPDQNEMETLRKKLEFYQMSDDEKIAALPAKTDSVKK